jgi:hypothetical protein
MLLDIIGNKNLFIFNQILDDQVLSLTIIDLLRNKSTKLENCTDKSKV